MGKAGKCVLMLLAVAFLLSAAFAYRSRGALLGRLGVDDRTCAVSRFESPPVGPLVILPTEGEADLVVQTAISPLTPLSGIDVGLRRMPNIPTVSGTLTLYDAAGAVVRTKRFDEPAFKDGVLRILFEPLPFARKAPFSFSLTVAPASSGGVLAQASLPTEYSEGALRINDEESRYSLYHRTVHPARWQARKLVDLLEHVKVPYFLAVAIIGLAAYRRLSYRTVYLMVALVSIYTVFAFMPYSKTDEEAHFDYVNHLVRHRELPLVGQKYSVDDLDRLSSELGDLEWSSYLWFGRRYVAVHPPLYYAGGAVVSALAGVFTESMAVRFYALRLLGALSLVATALLIGTTYEALAARSVIARSDLLFAAVLALFLLSPGFQTIVVPITNEQLALPLMSLHLLILARMWPRQRATLRDALLLSAATGLLLLTKTTALHIVPLVVVFLLARRSWAGAGVYLCCTSLLLLPWLAFNLRHYGAVTGVAANLEIVAKSLGALSLSPGSLVAVTDRFVGGFLLSYDRVYLFRQRSGFGAFLATAWQCLAWSAIGAYCALLLAHGTRVLRGRAAALPGDLRWGSFCLLAITLSYLLLALTSIRYSLDLFDPRYLYMNVLAATFCLLVLARRLGTWGRGIAAAAVRHAA